ncbi:uncharacterized protein LOC123219641 [Mangifera indica]|uniref:uncharacterized protein LOC123219641 n=1 Tax=Mangifera indica TaxID=29780 RepID=UPI001CFBF7DF|nr:uncharacterized protein LOC123219641 [Mangifera indica]
MPPLISTAKFHFLPRQVAFISTKIPKAFHLPRQFHGDLISVDFEASRQPQMAKKDISRKRRRVDSELRIPDESRHFRADAISRAQRTALSRISSTLTPRNP